MILTTRISNKLNFVIGIHNVPLELLEEKDDTYALLYEDKENKCLITLMGSAYNFIKRIKSNEKTKGLLSQKPIYITKNDSGTINLHIRKHIHIDFIPKNYDNKQPLIIEVLDEKLVSLQLETHNKTEVLRKEIKKAKRNYDKYQKIAERKYEEKQERRRKAIAHQIARETEKAEKREEILALVEKFNELERRTKTYVQEDKNLSNKGIYLVDPRSFKRCENCANYTRTSICSAHNLEVSENHSCSRFYSYRTVYGGSFSSK